MTELHGDASPAVVPGCVCCAPRRGFLTGLAALGAAGLLPTASDVNAAAPIKPRRIDIHHHLLPQNYVDEISARRADRPPAWTPARSVEDMDKNGIATSITSLIQPGVWFDDVPKGRRMSRESNDYAARMMSDYPGRFGMFATLPLPDPEGSLQEIAYALDTLKADGIGLMTSYGDKYLGDASFAPVWEELNRRKAVVYTHPLAPNCCRNLNTDVPASSIEYATDTTRTIASLLFSGTAARYPDIRWIFSHGGGTAPFLISRFTRQEQLMKEREQRLPRGVLYELKKFHYEIAQANHGGALAALLKLVPTSQVLFGTDFPFRPGEEALAGLRDYRLKSKDVRAIERGNALALLPRLRG
jgi:predicted TIM-barrel fold metal-dependent hydrolase